jgi:hypothetical protein
MKNREAYVKKAIVTIGIVLRLLMLIFPFILYKTMAVPGFRPDQFEVLLCIILPLSCLYLSLFLKFISQNRYQLEGEPLNQFKVNLAYVALLFLNLLELTVIFWKAMDSTVLEDNNFYILIASVESCAGIYVGFYLSGLFNRQKGGIN